jgi:hypothetical protein
VWCFFAAGISFVIFYIVHDAHRKFHYSGPHVPKEMETA